MGAAMGTDKARARQEELEKMMNQLPPDVHIEDEVPFKSWWMCSAIGALIAIPVGIKRKSYGPLVVYGMTGTLLDVLLSIQDHEIKREKWLREYLSRNSPSEANAELPEFAEGEDTEMWNASK